MKRTAEPVPASVSSLTGKFIGRYKDDHTPVVFRLEDIQWLPIFSTPLQFDEAMSRINSPVQIQIITDGATFFESIEGKIRLMLDPWITDEGNTRFQELIVK